MSTVRADLLGGAAETPARYELLWTLALLGTALLAGPFVVRAPFLFAAVVLGGLLLIAALVRPLLVLAIALLIGPVDLSFLTGGLRALFPSLGGLDMNGVRLIGISFGLGVTALALPQTRAVLFGRYGIFYVLFLAWAAATLAWSPNRLDGLRLWLHIAYPLLIFVTVVGIAARRQDLDRMVDFALVGAAIVAFVLNPYFAATGAYETYAAGYVRVRGAGLNPNPIAFYMLVCFYVSFMRLLLRHHVRYLLLCAALGLWVALTLSRITFLAALVGLAGIAVYAVLALRNPRVLTAAVAAAVLLAIALIPAVVERTFGYRMSAAELLELARSPLALYESINWHGRELAWPIVFAAFLAAPWSGLGLGSSMLIMRQYFPPQMTEFVHNDYLRLATEAGMIGVLLFTAALIIWLSVVLRAERDSGGLSREFAVPALAGLLSWGTIAITDNALNFAPFTQTVALLVGATVACARLPRAEAS